MSVTVKSVKPAGFWRDAPRNTAERYNELLPRDARLATPGQLQHLKGLWVQVTRQKTWGKAMAAFREFLQGRSGLGISCGSGGRRWGRSSICYG